MLFENCGDALSVLQFGADLQALFNYGISNEVSKECCQGKFAPQERRYNFPSLNESLPFSPQYLHLHTGKCPLLLSGSEALFVASISFFWVNYNVRPSRRLFDYPKHPSRTRLVRSFVYRKRSDCDHFPMGPLKLIFFFFIPFFRKVQSCVEVTQL